MNKLLNELIYYITEEKPGQSKKYPGYYKLPGFGLYGKSPEGPATHRAVKGSLVPVAQDTGAKKSSAKVNAKEPVQTSKPPKAKLSKIDGVPQSAAVPMTNAPGKISAKPLNPKEAAKDNKKLNDLRKAIDSNAIKFDDADHKKRAETFMGLWQAFVSAPTYEEQVKAVSALIDQNMIEGGSSGKKIYIADTVGLPYKGMSGDTGTTVTKLMNQIVKDEGLDLPPREGTKASRQAAESGPTNEAGVAALLDPSDENNREYEERKRRFADSGGDVDEIDRLNRGAAEAVRSALPPGARVRSAKQVGGVGAKKLKDMGIDPRTDPTDIIVEYEENGETKTMKVSAKIYTNPDRITMKNAGLEDAGDTYLGEPEGAEADEIYRELRANPDLDWTAPGLSEKERTDRKRQFRQAYLQKFSEKMGELASDQDPNSPGQQRLLAMWQKVHGCGKDVHTLVVNKRSGKSELKGPDHYCSPKLPFKVKYNGSKVVIEMDSGGPQTLEINLKTESSGGTKLLFNHVTRRRAKKAGE